MTARVRLIVYLAFAGLLAVAWGCTESSVVDDEDSAPVVLEIATMTPQPVNATLDQATGVCTFEVQQWSATANNRPKNAQAITSPFNDINLIDVTIAYTCALGASCPPTRTLGLTGTVPANGSVGFTFDPILLHDLNLSLAGTSLNLDMVFRANAISGESITYPTGAVLAVSSCS